MRSFLASAFLSIWACVAFADAQIVGWTDLVDQDAQDFEDPFRNLSFEQLGALRTHVRVTERLGTADLTETERSTLTTRLSEAEARLAADGIDADWVISQRWVVADRRQKAMISGNSGLDGKEVSLAGFAIPAPPDGDGTRMAYLVPERGMCSHMPPPPPNQLVRLRLDGDWEPAMMHEPVVVSGVLSISPSERRLMVVDGLQTLNATFAMEVVDVETFAPRPAPAPPAHTVNRWGQSLAEKIQTGRTPDAENQ